MVTRTAANSNIQWRILTKVERNMSALKCPGIGMLFSILIFYSLASNEASMRHLEKENIRIDNEICVIRQRILGELYRKKLLRDQLLAEFIANYNY